MRTMNLNSRGPRAQTAHEYDLMLFGCSFHVKCVLQVIEMSPSDDSEYSSINYYIGIARSTLEASGSSSGSTYRQVMQLTSRQSIGTWHSRKSSSVLIRMDQVAQS